MLNLMKYFPMMFMQQLGTQELGRTPAPSPVMSDTDSVNQYDHVMTTKLVIIYALGLEAIYRARSAVKKEGAKAGTALDLACGSGHYTLCLAKYLGYENVTGVDLSSGMIEIAQKNADAQRLNRNCAFEMGDVTDLKKFQDNAFDLTNFAGTANRLPNLETVKKVLNEMERVTKADGLIILMDLARLRTARLTEQYVNLLGADYILDLHADFVH